MSDNFYRSVKLLIIIYVCYVERGNADVPRGEESGGRNQILAVLAWQTAFGQATDS